MIINGLCQCGCGTKTNLYRGKYRKFIQGYNIPRNKNKTLEELYNLEKSNKIKLKQSISRKKMLLENPEIIKNGKW